MAALTNLGTHGTADYQVGDACRPAQPGTFKRAQSLLQCARVSRLRHLATGIHSNTNGRIARYPTRVGAHPRWALTYSGSSQRGSPVGIFALVRFQGDPGGHQS